MAHQCRALTHTFTLLNLLFIWIALLLNCGLFSVLFTFLYDPEKKKKIIWVLLYFAFMLIRCSPLKNMKIWNSLMNGKTHREKEYSFSFSRISFLIVSCIFYFVVSFHQFGCCQLTVHLKFFFAFHFHQKKFAVAIWFERFVFIFRFNLFFSIGNWYSTI